MKDFFIVFKQNLHYKCEVAKLGTAATGKLLLGMREPLCNVAKLNRISGLPKALKFINVRWCGGGGADTCKAWVAQLVLDNITVLRYLNKLTERFLHLSSADQQILLILITTV